MTQPSILQPGSTGTDVERLQRDLSQLGYEIAVDKPFGQGRRQRGEGKVMDYTDN